MAALMLGHIPSTLQQRNRRARAD